MNPAIDPCEDFSAYTCKPQWLRSKKKLKRGRRMMLTGVSWMDNVLYVGGGFWEREEIPADKESIGYFRIVADQNNVRCFIFFMFIYYEGNLRLQLIDKKKKKKS
jgi:hypothetical protein